LSFAGAGADRGSRRVLEVADGTHPIDSADASGKFPKVVLNFLARKEFLIEVFGFGEDNPRGNPRNSTKRGR